MTLPRYGPVPSPGIVEEVDVRRTLLTALFVAVAGALPPAHAAPSPQLTDPVGDWAVQSQDFSWARVSSVLVGGRPHLRGELRLVAAPAGAPTTYGFWLGAGCAQYGFRYEWTGVAERSTPTFDKTVYCGDRDTVTVGPDQTWPVTFAVNGTTLTWTVPYVGGVAKGLVIDGFVAQACSTACGVWVGTDWDDEGHAVWTSDVGLQRGRYVVGSDLPRR